MTGRRVIVLVGLAFTGLLLSLSLPAQKQQTSSEVAPPQTGQPPPSQSEVPAAQPKADWRRLSPEQSPVVALTGPWYVEVPVTVKDANGNRISGLTWRDFAVYENNIHEPIRLFSVDPAPLSIAFVIDQTLPSSMMADVNESLSAIQSALARDDEVAVFTCTSDVKEWAGGFIDGQSARLSAVLSLAKTQGADPKAPIQQTLDRPAFPIIPEIHTLNDAILEAAKELSTRPRGRRRIVYVISDGREFGSKAARKEVTRYLETNNIAVYGTLVGDSANWAEGWLDPIHPSPIVYGNILYRYMRATGGDMFAARNVNTIEGSYARIIEEARNRYIVGYTSHASLYDGKFRSVEVRVDRANVIVIAKVGYYDSDRDSK